MKITAVIMAGGRGERFWPRSRLNCPKQFLAFSDDGKTMLQQTAERLLQLISYDDMYIVANRDYLSLINAQLPQVPAGNILLEPMPKSTAPCIGLASAVIGRKYGDAVMIVTPSDHLIQNDGQYIESLKKAVEVSTADKNLVTIGITPTYPETGYGYIRFEPESAGRFGECSVQRFVEKPDRDTAARYLKTGEYLWNSGMFVWKLSTIMERFCELLPDIHSGILKIRDAWGTPSFARVLEECYRDYEAVSVDYGIMERADRIFTVPGSFGWDDAGSWSVLERMNKTDERGNMVRGDVVVIGAEKSIIVGGKKLIAAVGIRDLVVVDTDDALLICGKEHTQDVKKIIENLRYFNRSELL